MGCMGVVISEHALERMRKRKVSEEEVMEVLENPEEIFYDTQTGYFVAVRKRNRKWLIVVYISGREIRVVTVVITSKFNIVENRVKTERWVKL